LGENKCEECLNYVTHYLDGGVCKARTNTTCRNILANGFDAAVQTADEAKNYSKTSDECLKCF